MQSALSTESHTPQPAHCTPVFCSVHSKHYTLQCMLCSAVYSLYCIYSRGYPAHSHPLLLDTDISRSCPWSRCTQCPMGSREQEGTGGQSCTSTIRETKNLLTDADSSTDTKKILLVNQNSQKKNKNKNKNARQFYTLYDQKFSNLRPLLSITFPQGF